MGEAVRRKTGQIYQTGFSLFFYSLSLSFYLAVSLYSSLSLGWLKPVKEQQRRFLSLLDNYKLKGVELKK